MGRKHANKTYKNASGKVSLQSDGLYNKANVITSSGDSAGRLTSTGDWTPSVFTAFKALLSARLCAAIWSIISDCDETYNYWEPTHFLIYKFGFETWEYSPVYALRSYFYILLHALPAQLYASLFHINKVLVFCYIRCLLGFTSAACETYFYKAVWERFGGAVARMMLAFSLFACGMFISSAAYLPSTFSMYFTMLAVGAWLLRKYAIAIMCVATSTLVGWPFACILGTGIAFDLLILQKKVLFFVKWTMLSAAVILVPVVGIDSYYYGKFVVAPLNIVLYNVFSKHGPDLYGTEDGTFYFINAFLNYNFVFVLALSVAPVLVLAHYVVPKSLQKGTHVHCWCVVLPMYLWILTFFTRAHKEERFLFPIYPLVAFSGALAMQTAENIICQILGITWRKFIKLLQITFVVLCSLLALSRILALYQGYRAPFDLFITINRMEQEMKSHLDINVCIGKEWHRFPGNFFLPDSWKLQFIQSEFRGQLPKPYATTPNATAVIPDNMNEKNEEEPSRYIDVKKCHYLIDVDVQAETPLEPRYSLKKDEWIVVFTANFLDNSRSPPLWRAFYIPWLTEQNCVYANYNLLKSKETKVKYHSKVR